MYINWNKNFFYDFTLYTYFHNYWKKGKILLEMYTLLALVSTDEYYLNEATSIPFWFFIFIDILFTYKIDDKGRSFIMALSLNSLNYFQVFCSNIM